MKTLNKSLVMMALTLTPALARAENCSALQNNANAQLSQAAQSLAKYGEAKGSVWSPFCAGFKIWSVCSEITTLIEANPHNQAFADAYSPLLGTAVRKGMMNSRELDAFHGMVVTLRGLHYTAKIKKDEAGKIIARSNAQGCGPIQALMALTDSQLVSASSKGKTGTCRVALIKGKDGVQRFKIKIGRDDFPTTGFLYTSIVEAADGLREALDSGSCNPIVN